MSSTKLHRVTSAKLSNTSSKLTTKRSSLQRTKNGHIIMVSEHDNLKFRPKTAFILGRINTKPEKQQHLKSEEDEICRLELESEKRKQFLRELDMIRDEKLGKNYDPFAQEKADKDSKLLDRALLAKHEQASSYKKKRIIN